jgi:hypothetical protein
MKKIITHGTGFPKWRYFNQADSSLHVNDPDLYLNFTPGTCYGHSGEGFLYLARVVAHLTGTTLTPGGPRQSGDSYRKRRRGIHHR